MNNFFLKLTLSLATELQNLEENTGNQSYVRSPEVSAMNPHQGDNILDSPPSKPRLTVNIQNVDKSME